MSKDHLSSQIYHDIRNYVFGISGVSKIILSTKNKEEIDQNEDLRLIKIISEQSDQISILIEDLLSLETQSSSSFSLKKVDKHNINDLIEQALIANQYFASQSQVQIIPNLKNNLPLLECDKIRMNQILSNVINNSIKYSLKNGKVKIATNVIDEKICIQISDNGIGMSPNEIKAALSGEGKNIDKSLLDKDVESHGFGLPIIKDLVELHKGRLEIESTKGFGTSIKLWFDLPKSALANNNEKTILLVEDNQVSAFILNYLLTKEGYKTHHATNGQEAIEILDANPNINLIITDGQMPFMHGYETAKNIREGKGFKNFTNFDIPIIALMGMRDDETMKRAKECGINHFTDKNLSKVKLLESVRNCL